MIEYDSAKAQLSELQGELAQLRSALKVDNLIEERVKLITQQEDPNLYTNIALSSQVNKSLKVVESKLDSYNKLYSRLDDIAVNIELAEEMEDVSELGQIVSELNKIAVLINDLSIVTLLRGKYDTNNAILTLHAGAGGTEAQDWCSMLYRMYTRYVEKKGYNMKILDMLDGDEAGLKSVTFLVSGINAYGYLRAEKGVHRLVRISPFDSNARRHTSFASLEVMPEIENDENIVINSEDLKVDTYRSSGAGGQHVNKTESAVRITHIPTNIIVACQTERSQIQNRETCMKMLKSKLIEKRDREAMETEQAIKGDIKKIEWGSQIRSYVFCPYTLVKDHRTGYECPNVQAVMDGEYIDEFIIDYLKKS